MSESNVSALVARLDELYGKATKEEWRADIGSVELGDTGEFDSYWQIRAARRMNQVLAIFCASESENDANLALAVELKNHWPELSAALRAGSGDAALADGWYARSPADITSHCVIGGRTVCRRDLIASSPEAPHQRRCGSCRNRVERPAAGDDALDASIYDGYAETLRKNDGARRSATSFDEGVRWMMARRQPHPAAGGQTTPTGAIDDPRCQAALDEYQPQVRQDIEENCDEIGLLCKEFYEAGWDAHAIEAQPPSARDELVAECERVLDELLVVIDGEEYGGAMQVAGACGRARYLLARIREGAPSESPRVDGER